MISLVATGLLPPSAQTALSRRKVQGPLDVCKDMLAVYLCVFVSMCIYVCQCGYVFMYKSACMKLVGG